MRTLPLEWNAENGNHWDLVLSPTKNWDAVSSDELDPDTGLNSGEARYCAQTVANSCRMFLDDAYFFRDQGVPYFEDVLGERPPRSLIFAYWRKASFIVPLVRTLDIQDYALSNRATTGQIRITTKNGSVENVLL